MNLTKEQIAELKNMGIDIGGMSDQDINKLAAMLFLSAKPSVQRDTLNARSVQVEARQKDINKEKLALWNAVKEIFSKHADVVGSWYTQGDMKADTQHFMINELKKKIDGIKLRIQFSVDIKVEGRKKELEGNPEDKSSDDKDKASDTPDDKASDTPKDNKVSDTPEVK